MGWRDWFRIKNEERSIKLSDFPWLASILNAPLSAGVVVTEQTALNFSAYFNGVDIISGQIGALPRIVYRRLADDERERATSLPAYRLLHDAPNGLATPIVFWQTLMAHVLTWGNGYAEIEFDKANRPIALWNITPDRIQPVVEGNRLIYRYNGQREIPPSDILHIPGLGYDGVKGYSVVTMARRSLGLGIATEQFGASYFGNGAIPGIVLEHPATLSPEAQERLKASWNAMHQGPDRAHRTAILEEGMKANKIGLPPEDSQFLQTREFNIVEVARWLNIPPHKLKHRVGERPGGNLEASQIEFLTDTLHPWLVRIEQEVNRKLLPGGGIYYTEHLVDAVLRMKATDRANAYKVYFDMGVMDAETIAKKENLPKPKPKPKPEPPTQPEKEPMMPMEADPKVRAAYRALIVDVTDRFIRREADRARRAAKKGPEGFAAWVESFYAAEVDSLVSHLSPVVAITTVRRGLDGPKVEEAARRIAHEHVARSREELLDLRKDDLEGQVDRLMKRWEKLRPLEMADKIAALDAAQGEGNAA